MLSEKLIAAARSVLVTITWLLKLKKKNVFIIYTAQNSSMRAKDQ